MREQERKTTKDLTRTIQHLPVFAEADRDPRAVGHGDVAISVSLLVGGDEDLEIPGRVHDGNGERRAHAETGGVKLLPALLLEGDLTFLMGLERRAHVGRNRQLVEIRLRFRPRKCGSVGLV